MRAGIYLSLVQWLFALTWTVYVVFLPGLAEAAGIARKWVVWILIADQLIFISMDLALGIAADRVAAQMRRLGPWIAGISGLSSVAFLLMPLAPASASVAAPTLLLLIAIWAVTSSALRAPIIALLGKHAQPADATWLTSLALLGLGLAGALAPWLTVRLRGLDPRLPFALAGFGLLVAVAGMGWAERRMRLDGPATPLPRVAPQGGLGPVFFAAIALLCLGFQVHTAINSAPYYLRLAAPALLEWLLPSFWVGFSLAIVPAAGLINRYGAATILIVGAVLGAASLATMESAANLSLLVAMQLSSGVGWALTIAAAIGVALAAGRSGREGRTAGIVFALLALGAALRLAVVATELHKMQEMAALLRWLPALSWAAAVLLCVVWMRRGGRAFAGPNALPGGTV